MRPKINDIHSGKELKRWYWLKAELITHCRLLEIPSSGSKAEITDRIAYFLDTGTVLKKQAAKRNSKRSTFNWAREELQLETVITNSYRNGPNVRHFFCEHIGSHFRFNIPFMQWMKDNIGKTLADAIVAWKNLEAGKQAPGYQSKIPASNQYNRYLRDFFADNPERNMKDARTCWAYKTQGPAPHRYQAEDLLFLQQNT